MNDQQKFAVLLATECILEAAKLCHPEGAPSGVVYAVLAEHGMTLVGYDKILTAMQTSGLVILHNDCIFLKEMQPHD